MNNQSVQTLIYELEDLVNYCPIPAVIRSKLLLELGQLRFQLINSI